MSYTTPFTAVAGTAWKASDWNTYGRDNIAWMATDSPACRAYNTTNISVANATDQALTFNSERYDNAGIHSTSSNTSRMVIPPGAGGKILFGGGVDFATSASGVRDAGVWLNGATRLVQLRVTNAGGGDPTRLSPISAYALSAADYIELYAYQTSGGALNVQAVSNYSPEFWMFWMRT